MVICLPFIRIGEILKTTERLVSNNWLLCLDHLCDEGLASFVGWCTCYLLPMHLSFDTTNSVSCLQQIRFCVYCREGHASRNRLFEHSDLTG